MLFQSKTAKRRTTPPVPYQAGMVAFALFEHTFTQAFTAATDILELGVLPAGAKLVSATLISEGLAATTAIDVGLLTGEAGEYDESRDIGDEIFTAAALNAEVDATLVKCLSFAPADAHRGIGVTLTQNQTAGAGKSIRLAIQYTY